MFRQLCPLSPSGDIARQMDDALLQMPLLAGGMAASMHYRCNGSLLNTEKFPNSFNAFDSLAEAYMRNGDVVKGATANPVESLRYE